MAQLPPSPSEYQNANLARRHLAWPWHALTAAFAGIVFVAVSICSLFIIPMFDRIFMDFKTELPLITKIMLAFSGWYRWQGFGLIWMLLLSLAVVGAGLIIDAKSQTDRPARLYAICVLTVMTLFGILFAVIMVFGLFATMIALTSSVSGSGNKR